MIKFNPRIRARYRLARMRTKQTGRVISEETRNAAQQAVNNYKKVGEVGKEVGRNVKTFMTSDRKINSQLGPKIKAALETAGPLKYAPLIPVPGATEAALAGVGINPFLKGAKNAAKRIASKTYSDRMIIFRQKEYTIQSGKYDGPKDMEEVPSALSVIGKTALAGAGIGGAVGFGLNKIDNRLSDGFLSGAGTGTKTGLLAGLGLKLLINSIHNPMTNIKYQEVDKQIRQQFGIVRISGITIGDTIEKRNKLDEKFAFNDRDILNYKINITIQDGKFTMYIFKLTDKELDSLNKTLDYYCKKYFGMNYESTILGNNSKDNSYIVNIIFTNYNIISNFLLEISNQLNCKINLLNNKAIVELKTREQLEEEEQKSFSLIPRLDKFEILEILSKNGLTSARLLNNKKQFLSEFVLNSVIDGLLKLSKQDLSNSLPIIKDDLNNKFLESTFNNSGLIEGMHYTVSKKNCPVNFCLSRGTLIISSLASSPEGKKMEQLYNQLQKDFYNKSSINKDQVIVYTYGVTNKSKLSLLLKKMVASGIKPNVLIL